MDKIQDQDSDSFDTDFEDKEEDEPEEKEESLKRKRFVQEEKQTVKPKEKKANNTIKQAKPAHKSKPKKEIKQNKVYLSQKQILEEAAMTELQNLESLRQYNRWIESECLANSFQTRKDRKFDCPTIKKTYKLDHLGNVITIINCPSDHTYIEEMKKVEYPEKMKCRITNEPAK